MRLININCQSLISKVGALRTLVTTQQPNIIVPTETCLTTEIYDAELIVDRNRGKQMRGGVLIAIRGSLHSTKIKSESDSETLWPKIILTGQQHLVISACLRPRVSDKTTVPSLKKPLDGMLDKRHKNVILVGDFNFPG